MTEENRTYITHLKVTDVPWHRLTTAYGRGTDFPAHLAVLEQISTRRWTRSFHRVRFPGLRRECLSVLYPTDRKSVV